MHRAIVGFICGSPDADYGQSEQAVNPDATPGRDHPDAITWTRSPDTFAYDPLA
jgi:hypothetical protein